MTWFWGEMALIGFWQASNELPLSNEVNKKERGWVIGIGGGLEEGWPSKTCFVAMGEFGSRKRVPPRHQ
jgi:hypothetical protein